MASNKKPSLYSDRGGIGSVNELDEYGVWVKSEPQVLSADSADTVKPGDLDDSVLSADGFASDGVPSDPLSFDDAVLDVKGTSKKDPSAFADVEFPDDDIEIDSSGDPLALDSNLDDLNITDTDLAVPHDDSSQSDNFEIEDTSFDDFEAPHGNSGSESGFSVDDDFDIKDDLDLDDFSDLTNSEKTEKGKKDNFEADDFAVPTVKAIENNVESIQKDFENVSKTKEGDLSTQLLLKIANELSSIRGELSDLKKEFSAVRPALPTGDDKRDKSGFFSEEDDETISLTGDELDNILVNTDEAAQETETSAEAPPDDSLSMSGEGFPLGGDDDDDEAIALTGDELDNILNSADFTEESGTNETVENDFSLDDEPEESHDDTEETKTDDDLDLGADFADMGADDDLGSSPAPEDEEVKTDAGGLASEDEDLDLGADDSSGTEDEDVKTDAAGLASLVSDDDLGSGLAPEDEDIDLGADFADFGADDSLGTEDEDVKSDAAGLASLVSDDDLGSGLAPEDEDIDLGADFAADGASQDSEIPDDDFALEENETADGKELIDIDTDDLNIDLDPDTLLSEQDEANLLSGSTEALVADEASETESGLDADLSAMDLTDDVLNDSEKHDSPELEHLRSEGVTPITPAPENSTYLEEEEDNSDSIDLSNAVIDEPALSADGINDDIEEPSLNESEFDLDSLDDLTIDSSHHPDAQEEEPASSQNALDDIDIDIPPEDDFTVQEQPAGEEDDLSFEPFDLDTDDAVTPEGFEAEAEEKPVPFDDDFGGALDIPGMADEDFSAEDLSPAPTPAPKAAPAAPQAPAAKAAPVSPVPAPSAAPQPAPAPKAAPAAVQKAGEGVPSALPPQMCAVGKDGFQIPSELKSELRNILSYMDQLLESLPEDKIEEFAKSEYFDSYKKLFKELGLV